MALTYNRLPAMMQRKSTRTPQPTRQAVESILQRPTRRVQFAPSTHGRPAPIPEISEDPSITPYVPAESQEMPGVPDKYAYKERLPQYFPHDLPPSSLEPGTSDQQYPSSQLFPEPPMGDYQGGDTFAGRGTHPGCYPKSAAAGGGASSQLVEEGN